jgi:hypothetical protein
MKINQRRDESVVSHAGVSRQSRDISTDIALPLSIQAEGAWSRLDQHACAKRRATTGATIQTSCAHSRFEPLSTLSVLGLLPGYLLPKAQWLVPEPQSPGLLIAIHQPVKYGLSPACTATPTSSHLSPGAKVLSAFHPMIPLNKTPTPSPTPSPTSTRLNPSTARSSLLQPRSCLADRLLVDKIAQSRFDVFG